MGLKERLIVRRNEQNTILPEETEIEIDGVKEKVMIRPLPLGVLQEFTNVKDENSPEAKEAAARIISTSFVNPSFTIEEAKDLKAGYANEIVQTILEISGFQKKRLQKA